jgi:hypothetical protein
LFNLAVLASILFVLSMTLVQILERLFIRRGERERRKIEAIRDKIQVKLEKKNHAR